MARTRPFRRTDAAILVAAVAIAAVVASGNDRDVSRVFDRDWVERAGRHWTPGVRALVRPALRVEGGINAILVVLTLGFGLIILRRPEVIRHRRWPGAGVVAIGVGALAVAFSLVRTALDFGTLPLKFGTGPTLSTIPPFADYPVYVILAACRAFAKGAILGAWTLLAISKRWRPDAGWLDRSGRLLGWTWLAMIGSDSLRSAIPLW